MKCLTQLGLFAGVIAAARIAAADVAPAPATFNVRDHGATGDGKTLDTAALNKAVDACAAAGGGVVEFPPGKFLTATVHLKSNVTLRLDEGAEIVGSPDP